MATVELKTDFTQSLDEAVSQYKKDRHPITNGRVEPLLSFGHRALVHFAVSNDLAAMTTRLEGDKTHFLPFNTGHEGGAGPAHLADRADFEEQARLGAAPVHQPGFHRGGVVQAAGDVGIGEPDRRERPGDLDALVGEEARQRDADLRLRFGQQPRTAQLVAGALRLDVRVVGERSGHGGLDRERHDHARMFAHGKEFGDQVAVACEEARAIRRQVGDLRQ